MSPFNTTNANEPTEPSTSADKISNTEEYVYNYACSLLLLGMILPLLLLGIKYYEDAIKEGDANREETFWKIAMVMFKAKIKNSNRVKYAFESC